MPCTLAIDFGSKYIGIALVSHPAPRTNRVLYAATLVVKDKYLKSLVKPRAGARRLRRTRKTHGRRLRRLAQALAGIPNAEEVLRFCRRRGYSYDEKEDKEGAPAAFQFHRSAFFQALRQEVSRLIALEYRSRVLAACAHHLNEACRRGAELRPARFENRGPTRCIWEGCSRHVPKSEHDRRNRLQQALVAWLLPVFAESSDPAGFREYVSDLVAGLTDRAAQSADDRKKAYGGLKKRVEREASAETAEKFKENWRNHYQKAVAALLRGEQAGRSRYCRQHAEDFINHLLAGKPIPNRQDITEADLVSRKQQILFRRLWRLVEARLLPLASGRIDRVVVERVAFDLLAGPLKARNKLEKRSPDRAARMCFFGPVLRKKAGAREELVYWNGPKAGFDSRQEMLRAEFGGRCAYCGASEITLQVEHLLPRSAFPFDSYFNLLPACATCNARKGARTALEAGLFVHQAAYEAYSDYVRRQRVPHVYHTIKKGLLNLLRHPATSGEAERRLAMLANNLVTVTATQRAPRPLARYLATRLEGRTGSRPAIAYCAGRHTALYRSALLAEYDKAEGKEEGDLRNHAVDAVVLGCDLPAATALENKNWNLSAAAARSWFEAVRAAAPETLLGLPRVAPVRFVPYFEEDLGGGYCCIDLSAFNWNRQRKATHQLDPFGQTQDGRPLKRLPAAEVLKALKDPAGRAGQIERIAHAGLRQLLRRTPDQAAAILVRWLQESVRVDGMGDHPADRARRDLLQRFAQAPVEKVVQGEEPVPPTIGIRCLIPGSQNKLGVARVDPQGRVIHRYQSQPVVRELYVAYRLRDGQPDRSRPVVFKVGQTYELKPKQGDLDLPADSPLRGRPHGVREDRKGFLARWREEFTLLCRREGLAEVFRLTQGCVVEKTDGSRLQLRNFDKTAPWMRAASLQQIRRVFRSPLQEMQAGRPEPKRPTLA